MCSNHLLGEHAETHMFVTKMEKGYSLKGFTDGSMFFGAEYVKARHDMIAEMFEGHKTPLILNDSLIKAYPFIVPQMDDLKKSLNDLFSRCPKCKHNFDIL